MNPTHRSSWPASDDSKLTRSLLRLVLCSALLGWPLSRPAHSETLSDQAAFTQRMMAPHSAVIQGGRLRDAIIQVACDAPISGNSVAENSMDGNSVAGNSPRRKRSQRSPVRRILNVWLDRKVDPASPVSPGSLGPTRYQSLRKIAAEADCVCAPINGCVLIGRPEWVDGVAQQILGDQPASRAIKLSRKISLAWPDLTTPTEALTMLRDKGVSANLLGGSLPHDLWPAQRWQTIPGGVAATLIASQFVTFDRDQTAQRPFQRSYRFPSLASADISDLLAIVGNADPSAVINQQDDAVSLVAGAAAHRRLANHCLTAIDERRTSEQAEPADTRWLDKLQQDKRTFSLTVENKPGGAVLVTLISQLGMKCEIDPAANQRLQQRVSFTARDETIWQLVSRVLRQSRTQLRLRDGKLRVVVQSPG
ncbi:MAG: hypothetical protein AAF745_14245 [Planctomycetota bacterium]